MTTELHTRVAAPAGLNSAGLLTLLLGAALNTIDFFVVNVALPTIETDLHASAATLEMVVAGYGISYAVLLVLGGRLGDAFGRRRLFRLGLLAFTVTSLVCGIAPNATTLVLVRIAQGAAAAVAIPQVLSIIQASTSGEGRARAMSLYSANAGLSMVVGQVLGGLLVAADVGGLGWRTIFLVNVPLGVAGLLLSRRTVPESKAANPLGIDRWGTVLLGTALLCLLVPLTEGSALGWPAWTFVLLGLALVLAAALVAAERRLERAGGVPLLPPSVLRVSSMRRGLLVAVPFFVGFGAFMFVCAVTLQEGLRIGPLGAGLALAPLAAGFFGSSLVNARLVSRFGNKVVTAGLAIQFAGLLVLLGTVLADWPQVTVLDFAPGTLVCGIGQGMAMTTVVRLVLSQVPADRAGVGSGVFTTTQQASLALGVAVLGSLFAGLSETMGTRDAFLLVIAIQAALTLGVTFLSRSLPDPRRS